MINIGPLKKSKTTLLLIKNECNLKVKLIGIILNFTLKRDEVQTKFIKSDNPPFKS